MAPPKRPPMPGDAMTPIKPLDALSDEERDTEADSPEARQHQQQRQLRRPRDRAPTRVPAEPEEIRDEGPPIKSVAQGRLSEVRMHETKVRRRASTIAGRRPSSTSGSQMRGFEAELVRSLDASQTIRRGDEGELVIEGLASGAMGPDDRAPTVSVMVDGAVYAVGLDPGDSPRDTAVRLMRRLERVVVVELVSADDDRAVLRLVGPASR